MGCSASSVSPEGEINANEEKKSHTKETNTNSEAKTNGHVKPSPQINKNVNKEEKLLNKRLSVDRNANKIDPMSQAPVPKSVAFEVAFNGETVDGLLQKRKRPPRLQALEPLNLPKLTPEQLAEKQRQADEKRERIKQKKKMSSEKSSRRRRDILQAKEFGMKQQMEQEKNELNESIRQAEIKREQKLQEVKEKQRMREERAKRIREKAKRMQNPDDEIEVEKDDQFNAASDDSWLENSEHQDENADPQKRVGQQSNLRNTVSASTVDSYDAAFMREHKQENNEPQRHDLQQNIVDDDFFGS